MSIDQRPSHVRVLPTPLTEALGLAGRTGYVFGQSIPSISGVGPVIGDDGTDYAINVWFEELDRGHWFALPLVELAAAEPAIPTDTDPDVHPTESTPPSDASHVAPRAVAAPPPPPWIPTAPPSLDRPAERSPADFLGRLLDRL